MNTIDNNLINTFYEIDSESDNTDDISSAEEADDVVQDIAMPFFAREA